MQRRDRDDDDQDRATAVIVGIVAACCICGLLIVGLVVGLRSHDPRVPDCCPHDPYAYPGSTFASTSPTLCGTYDYNCDGRDDQYACTRDASIHDGARALWDVVEDCLPEPLSPDADTCGACDDGTVLDGWQCSVTVSRKRFVPACPCAEGPVAVPGPPDIGECALRVVGCVGASGSDVECAVVVAQ